MVRIGSASVLVQGGLHLGHRLAWRLRVRPRGAGREESGVLPDRPQGEVEDQTETREDDEDHSARLYPMPDAPVARELDQGDDDDDLGEGRTLVDEDLLQGEGAPGRAPAARRGNERRRDGCPL